MPSIKTSGRPNSLENQSNTHAHAVRLRDLAVAAAVTATYLLVGAYVNLPLREALKRAVGGQVPYWLDHISARGSRVLQLVS